jgi:H+/Cl- antiporter ClcA
VNPRYVVYACIAFAAGGLGACSSAALLAALDWATHAREHAPWLVLGLPALAALLGLALRESAISPSEIGARMLVALRPPAASASVTAAVEPLPTFAALLVVLGASASHLLGASVGREGAAAQIGAILTQSVLRRAGRLRLPAAITRELGAFACDRLAVLCGVSAGFAGVFGTPLAACIFALELAWPSAAIEVAARARLVDTLRRAPWPLLAAFVADAGSRALGTVHSAFPHVVYFNTGIRTAAKWLVLALLSACLVRAFVGLTALLRAGFARLAPGPRGLPWRLAAGGSLLLAFTWLGGSRAYLGLGVPQLLSAFSSASVLPTYASCAKLLATSTSVAAGFPGGEVTPLFFMGATLGHAAAPWLGLPTDAAAAMGMTATFGAAAKTPLALAVMAAELFGWAWLPTALAVCIAATWLCASREWLKGALLQRFERKFQRVQHGRYAIALGLQLNFAQCDQRAIDQGKRQLVSRQGLQFFERAFV